MEDMMISFLRKFTDYPFAVRVNGREYQIGEGKPEFAVTFKRPIPKRQLLTSTSLALGEAYMDGDLEIEGDLYYALDHFLGQMGKFSTNEPALKRLMRPSTSKRCQKQEVSSHYDIGNEFYRLWLDETMSYSCGYFKRPDDTLRQAQINKVDYILQKLNLKPGMTLLDIGCGWGFLLMEAAKKYGVRGFGITLSKEQKTEFERRIREEHLEGVLEVELMDYRDLPACGRAFDRVVSVGMVEHVGRPNYQKFIRCVSSVLNEGGVFLLHFISALTEHTGDPWIRKYIFPGGTVPSLREMCSAMGEDGFHIMDVENLRLHYNKTLLCWADNFHRHLDEERKLFDERFLRMWDLYLNACAATFHNGIIDLHQIVATRGIDNSYPMVRWY